MNKLLRLFDNYILKIGVAFTIIFTALYPKLPSIHVTNTWVYIRLEDFLITALVVLWFIQLLRKKVKLPFPLGWGIVLYWIIGALSLIISLIFIGPHLANFFPKIAALQYLRRIEYIILFFVAYATVKSKKDIRDYLIVLCITVAGVCLYGFGQKFYLLLWHQFPKFFEKNPFCFPSFQTGNEEFAKGIPLCLPPDARTTSTFGGHYDLAAYLVFVLPILIGSIFAIKKWVLRLLLGLLSVAAILLLILTASRVSFVAYLIGVTAMLIWIRQKKYMIPVIGISILLLITFSGSAAKRFLQTIRLTSIVTTNQGEVVGEAVSTLPSDLRKRIAKNPVALQAPPPSQNLPAGSGFIALPPEKAPVATNVAVVTTQLPSVTSRKLNLTYGGIQISTVSGSFLIQKAFVYDISFTTRFQGEWPHAWAAFMKNPPLGTGYSSITLSSDNDYVRALGETGFLGLTSFLLIFVLLGVTLRESVRSIKDTLPIVFLYGIAGGVIGLFINAVLIDVFEASKVAEPLWLLLGIGTGTIMLYHKKPIAYLPKLAAFFTSHILIAFYLFIATMIFFMQSINNFFVADDFTWLRWAASSTTGNIVKSFTDAGGFFYRPLPKVFMFLLYTVFSFQPEGYHFFMFILHWLMAFGVYLLAQKIFNNKFFSFTAGIFFLLLPAHGENVYWISTLSANLASVFIIYGILFFIRSQEKKAVISYICSVLFGIFALLSYEMSTIYPLLIILSDTFFVKHLSMKKRILSYIPFVFFSLGYIPLRTIVHALPPGGDYAVNFRHVIPNFFGNLLGYLGIFLKGESFFTSYNILRVSLRSHTTSILIALCLLITGVIIYSFFRKKQFLTFFKNRKAATVLFLIAFIIISLLPFIGLGNISERYGYLASVGFVLLITFLLQTIQSMFTKNKRKISYICISALVLCISTWYVFQLSQENADWNSAGMITRNTLSLLRLRYLYFRHRMELVFINVPIKKAQAWIFPVGLRDGIWFIYRDPSFDVVEVASIKDAINVRTQAQAEARQGFIMLMFDKQGYLSEVN